MTDKKRQTDEPEPAAAKKNSIPSEMKGIGTRIKEVAAAAGSKRALANKAGIHETQLYRYISEGSLPSAGALVAMAREGGVNLEWLCEGTGPKWREESNPLYQPAETRQDFMTPDERAATTAHKAPDEGQVEAGSVDLTDLTDLHLMGEVMAGLEELIETERLSMTYAVKAELTMLLYDYFRGEGENEITARDTAKVVHIFNQGRKNRGDDDQGSGRSSGPDKQAL